MLAFSTFQQARSYLLMNRAGEGVMSSYVVSTRVILAVTSNATRSLYPLLVAELLSLWPCRCWCPSYRCWLPPYWRVVSDGVQSQSPVS